MTSRTAALLCLLAFSGCGGTAPVAPTPAIVSVGGTVAAQDGSRLSDATVRIDEGPNAGRSTTTGAGGAYRFDGLTAGSARVLVAAHDYEPRTTTVYIDGTKPLDFTLRTAELWSRSGTGNAVFDMPSYITQVHVVGVYTGVSTPFTVHIGGCAIVEDTLGTSELRTRSEGIYSLIHAGVPAPRTDADGRVEIVRSPGVSWSIIEDRTDNAGPPCYLLGM